MNKPLEDVEPLSVEQALCAYDNNKSRLADALGIDKANISMWHPKTAIPRVHALFLRKVIKISFFKGVKFDGVS